MYLVVAERAAWYEVYEFEHFDDATKCALQLRKVTKHYLPNRSIRIVCTQEVYSITPEGKLSGRPGCQKTCDE
jgi:hypothetical protein